MDRAAYEKLIFSSQDTLNQAVQAAAEILGAPAGQILLLTAPPTDAQISEYKATITAANNVHLARVAEYDAEWVKNLKL